MRWVGDVEISRRVLLKRLVPGDTVYTILRHRARSGMTRCISPVTLRPARTNEFRPSDITFPVGRFLQRPLSSEHGGVKCVGTGMDMGFDLVYSLSHALWPEGFDCIGPDCPSNDHVNGDRNYEPHHHANSGYALRQEWL